MTQFARY